MFPIGDYPNPRGVHWMTIVLIVVLERTRVGPLGLVVAVIAVGTSLAVARVRTAQARVRDM